MSAINRIILFDFDDTLIDTFSDHHVTEKIINSAGVSNGSEVSVGWRGTWLDYMNDKNLVLKEKFGATLEKYKDALATLPFTNGMPELVRNLSIIPGTQLMILSDCNPIYIEYALKSKNIYEHFSRVICNRGFFDHSGLLHVEAIAEQAKRASSKMCLMRNCQPYFCKGCEVQMLLKEHSASDPSVWFIGDGWNDFCVALSLSSTRHHVFARRNYDLASILARNADVVQCGFSTWTSGKELLESMKSLDDHLL